MRAGRHNIPALAQLLRPVLFPNAISEAEQKWPPRRDLRARIERRSVGGECPWRGAGCSGIFLTIENREVSIG
jgi:hypothetical protein